MVYPETFNGFQVDGPETWTEFHKRDYQPKPFEDYDVDVKIHACGICGSDLHTISGGVCLHQISLGFCSTEAHNVQN